MRKRKMSSLRRDVTYDDDTMTENDTISSYSRTDLQRPRFVDITMLSGRVCSLFMTAAPKLSTLYKPLIIQSTMFSSCTYFKKLEVKY